MHLVDIAAPPRLGPGFRRLLASSWISNLGDGISVAAGPLLVASLTHDPLPVALAALLRWAPQLLFGLYAGVLADRLDRRLIVVTADLIRTAVLTALVVTIATGKASIVVALAATGLLSTAEVFADSSSSTLLPMLVGREDLALANSRLQAGMITLNQLAGPSIGAVLFAAGSAWPFATQAVLVGLGALLVYRLALPPHGPAAGPTAAAEAAQPAEAARTSDVGLGIRREIAEGFRWLIHHPAVRTLALTIFVFNITFGAAWSVLVLYATQRLGLRDIGFGLVTGASAAGGLVGTTMYGWITRRVSLGNIMRVGLVIETLTHLALALTTTPWIAMAVFFVFGAHAFVWGTTSITVRQRAVPTQLQGRVGSVYTVGVYGGLVAGSAVGGVLAQWFGVTAPFWFAFGGSALFLVLIWGQLRHVAHTEDRPIN